MPRIRDLKDQQLYRVEKGVNYGVLSSLLNKTADMEIVEEQWETMIRVAILVVSDILVLAAYQDECQYVLETLGEVHGYPDGVCNCFYRRKPGFNRFIRGKHVF
jgi:hypothetical protein